jgi:dihydrofolate synthase/folylpolyglutamate synthase
VDQFSEVMAKLHARIPLGMRLGLGPMLDACERHGRPERSFAAVHVAGTNGKGSVCAMVEAIARAHGLRVGLYTSPHLSRFAERIRIGGEPIDDPALIGVLGRVLDGSPDLSFFEAATLAAFLAFREARVDLAVVEVGLGGRLDATNVLPKPEATAITRIALDHMDRLGPTLVDIAREKAGIAKAGIQLVVGRTTPEVRGAIDEVARAAGTTTLDAEGADSREFLANNRVSLEGRHQLHNATIAYRLAKQLTLPDAAIAAGLAGVRWPGRMERVDLAGGPYLLDAAHNPDGADALARYLESLTTAPRALVFGALADKAWTEMIDRLAPLCSAARVCVAPQGRTAASPAEVAARCNGVTAASVAEALERARELAPPGALVVVAGSIFLVGEARSRLLGLPLDPLVAL